MSWQVAVQLAVVAAVVVGLTSFVPAGPDVLWLRGPRALVAEVGRVLALYALWQFTRERTVTRVVGATENARTVWHVERWLHLPSELTLQRAFLPHRWLMTFMDGYYAIAHITVMGVVLVWMYWRHRDHYPTVRNILAMTTIISILIHMNPVAPPRFMTSLGFVDSSLVMGHSVYGAGGGGMSNQLAAFPSLHYAWAVICMLAVLRYAAGRWRWLIVLHLVLTALAVTVTANHWWLDGVAAVGVMVVAWGLQSLLAAAMVRWWPANRGRPVLVPAFAEADALPQPRAAVAERA